MMKKLNNDQEFQAFAFDFANKVNRGDIIAFSGPLGAGKTTFIKALGKGLGINQLITSPTFTIIKEYDDLLCHIDAYRINDELIGIDDYLERDFIICIEWAENIKNNLPFITYNIKIDYDGEGRIITIS